MKLKNKIFAILCSVLLVFSAISPSVTFADNSSEITKTIIVDAGNDERTINEMELIVYEQFEEYSSEEIEFVSNFENNSFDLDSEEQEKINLQANYLVSWKIEYSEESNDYTYIDQIVVNGSELLSLNTITIPVEDDLNKTILETSLFTDYVLDLIVGNDSLFNEVIFTEANINGPINLVVRKDSRFSVLFHFQGILEYKRYLISETLDMTKDSINFDDYKADLVYLQFDTDSQVVFFGKGNHTITGTLLNKDIFISKGDYWIDYKSNNRDWEGAFLVDETLQNPVPLPDSPNAIKVSINSIFPEYPDLNTIRIYYMNEFMNGSFSYTDEVDQTVRILDGETVITELSKFGSIGEIIVSMDDYPTGDYTLYFETNIDNHKIFGSTPFRYTAPEDYRFVTIETNNFVTNNEEITIEGNATNNSSLTATLRKNENTIETKDFTATADGTFTVSFSQLGEEGEYTVVVEAAGSDAKDEVNVTIDRTAPEKVNDIVFTNSSDGLNVTWTGDEDTASYKVEVKEDDGEFLEVSHQESLTYVISPVQQGVTYEVRITSIDLAGNTSISDPKTFTVLSESDEDNVSDEDSESNEDNESENETPSENNNGNSNGSNTNNSNSTPVSQNTVTEELETEIKNQVADSNKKSVELKGTAISESQPTTNVEITTEVLKAIADAGKPLVINYGDIQVEVPAAVIKEASANSSAKTKFEVAIVKDANVSDNGTPLSDVYEFTITADNAISSFDEPIVITIPVNGSAVNDANRVAAYYVNENTQQLEFVISKYDNGAVTFKTKHFSKFVVIENSKTFEDAAKHWAKEFIESLASRGIVSGKSSDTFAPEDSITRAEFAAILSRMLNLPKQAHQGTFSDVVPSWASADIEAAYRTGIVSGFNGQFNPNDKISRQDMAAMIVRAAEYLDASVLQDAKSNVGYADESLISDYAKENVKVVSALGIANGSMVDGKRVFAPKDDATRAEAATMLFKLLEILSK